MAAFRAGGAVMPDEGAAGLTPIGRGCAALRRIRPPCGRRRGRDHRPAARTADAGYICGGPVSLPSSMRVSVTAAMRRRSPITHGDEQGFGDVYCVADHGGLPGRQTGMRMDGVASDGCYQKQRSVVDHQCSSVRRSPPARPASGHRCANPCPVCCAAWPSSGTASAPLAAWLMCHDGWSRHMDDRRRCGSCGTSAALFGTP